MSDPRLVPRPGAMNGDKSDQFGITLTEDTLDSTYALRSVIDNHILNPALVKFPRKAICLYAEEYTEDPENSYTGVWNASTNWLGLNSKRIRIKAYDDFLNSGLPMPNIGVTIDKWTPEELAAFNLLPWHYQESTDKAGATTPAVGDIVVVDYHDRANLLGGLFIEVHESLNLVPSGDPNAKNPWSSPVAAFKSLFSSTPGATATTPAYTAVEDLCEGPIMQKSDQIGNEPGENVETVIIDGAPVAKDIAGYYVSMRDAASSEGVTLRINSGFRGYEDVAIPAECGGGTKSGQNSLYAQYGPGVAARPGRSKHQNGIALDLQTGMPKDEKNAYPDRITPHYLWLMNNSHKFGFIRTVKTERWHFEYAPGSSQFARVPKDHPTWDNHWLTNGSTA
tara:strand:+ start:12126 stop:13307 length:1182 start_codon:yes stop_codon:yes gene_type:complete